MYYDEKREIRLQISQLLADAGINQQSIKEMVNSDLDNKIDRAIQQVIQNLDSNSYSGNFINDKISEYFKYNTDRIDKLIQKEIHDTLADRIISIQFDESVKPESKVTPSEDSNNLKKSDLDAISDYDVTAVYQPGDLVKYGDSYYTFGTLQKYQELESVLSDIKDYLDIAEKKHQSAKSILNTIRIMLRSINL